jgi:hypothetical protein
MCFAPSVALRSSVAGSGLFTSLARAARLGEWGAAVEPESSNLSHQMRCSRCQRAPRDDDDYVGWEALDEGAVCPGCLTMLETEARRRSG